MSLCPGINVLVGDNAQGKTNLLEAVYLTCVGRGFRTPRDRELIMFGQDGARVKTIVAKKYGDNSVEVRVNSSQKTHFAKYSANTSQNTGSKKSILVNDVPIQKMGELMGTVTCVFFNPDELRLIKEAPSDRRRFMDIDISQMDKVYFYNLLRYNKILQQRNALLKNIQVNSAEMQGLDIWDEQLAAVGEAIIKRRLEFVGQLRTECVTVHSALTINEHIDIFYEHTEGLKDALCKAREKDLRLKTTTVGPHRDDLCITINGKDVRAFASQGQQRTAALSLKLAELKIFEDATGEKPVLLLDDVLSELDTARQEKLLRAIDGCQSIITTTKFAPREGVKIIHVKNGKCF